MCVTITSALRAYTYTLVNILGLSKTAYKQHISVQKLSKKPTTYNVFNATHSELMFPITPKINAEISLIKTLGISSPVNFLADLKVILGEYGDDIRLTLTTHWSQLFSMSMSHWSS